MISLFGRVDPYGHNEVRGLRSARRVLREADVLSTYSTPVERKWASHHLTAVESWLNGRDVTSERLARLARDARRICATMRLDRQGPFPLAA